MHIMICRKSAVQLQLTLSGDPDLDGLLMLEAPPVGGCGVPPGDVLLLPGAWNPGCKKTWHGLHIVIYNHPHVPQGRT